MSQDTDEELIEIIKDPILTWRGDGRDNLADWCLQVTAIEQQNGNHNDDNHKDDNNDNNNDHACPDEEVVTTTATTTTSTSTTTITYHVHRVKLAHSSPRFLHLIRNASEQRTEIELPESQARVVPDMLDFVYGVPHVIQEDNAIELYTLAKSWELEYLQKSIRAFWKSRLQWQNMMEYAEKFRSIMDDSLLSMLAQVCADNFEKLQHSNHALLANATISLWPKVLEKVQQRMCPVKVGNTWAGLLIPMLYKRYLDIPYFDANVFHELTQDKYIPEVSDTHVAWTFLKIAVQILSDEMASNLRERCVKCLVEHCCELDLAAGEGFPEPIRETLEMHSPSFLVAFCGRMLSHAISKIPDCFTHVVFEKERNAESTSSYKSADAKHELARKLNGEIEIASKESNSHGEAAKLKSPKLLMADSKGQRVRRELVSHSMSGRRIMKRRYGGKVLDLEVYPCDIKDLDTVSRSLESERASPVGKSHLCKKGCEDDDLIVQKSTVTDTVKTIETSPELSNKIDQQKIDASDSVSHKNKRSEEERTLLSDSMKLRSSNGATGEAEIRSPRQGTRLSKRKRIAKRKRRRL